MHYERVIMTFGIGGWSLTDLPNVGSVRTSIVALDDDTHADVNIGVHMIDTASPLPVLDFLAERMGEHYRVKRTGHTTGETAFVTYDVRHAGLAGLTFTIYAR